MSGQKWQLLMSFKPLIGFFLVVRLYSSEETYIRLELPFHAELNGIRPNSVY